MSLLAVRGFVPAHDPTIVRNDGLYYRFQTGPGIPVSVSKNLLDWELLGKVFAQNPAWTAEKIPGSTDFWAPEVVRRNGVFRLYYSVSTFGKNTSAIGMAQSADLRSWDDKGAVILSSPSDFFNAIDPAVCKDEHGHDWLLFGSFWGGLQLVRLDEDGFVSKGSSPLRIASRRRGIRPGEENPIEGGFIFPHDGKFYLFASHDFCCRGTASSYHIVVGVADKITGPYLDADGVDMMDGGGTLLRDGFSFARWAGPGHNSVFHDDDGTDYLVYHAYDRENDGRSCLMIEKITWRNGFPTLD